MTIVISITTMVRSKAPLRHISQFAQSGVVGWGGGWGGTGGGVGSSGAEGGSGNGNSVVKAPTALQTL